MSRTKHVSLFIGAALLLALGAISVYAQPGKKDDGRPGEPWDSEPYGRDVAASRGGLGPQSSFLAEFAPGQRDYTELPVVEIEASIGPVVAVEQSLGSAGIVALARVSAVEFSGSEIGDVPQMTIRYTVMRGSKGASEGEDLSLTILGGPYSPGSGPARFVVLPFFEMPVVGQRYLLMLNRTDSGLQIPSPAAVLRLAADGSVAETRGSRASGASGRSAVALVEAVPPK